MPEQQAIETVSEAFGSDEASKARRWINELDLSQGTLDTWLGRCRKIIRRYKDERGANSALLANDRRRFATLWSNVEVLKPATYAKCPVPLVTRRFNDPDPVGRVASEVLERALSYTIEEYDFDWVMKQVRDDLLLPGAGITWIRYVPTVETEDEAAEPISDSAKDQAEEVAEASGQPGEYVKTEAVVCDHVNYTDWGTNKARTWDEVRFVWRRVYMAREQLKARFGKKVPGLGGKTVGDVIPLDWKPETNREDSAQAQNNELFAKAQIFEIWDLDSKSVYWVSKSYPVAVLDEAADPLGLKDFFPCPRPVYSTLGPDSIIPVPDYIFYQDQAEEIDDLTLRIGILTDSLRMVGFYNGTAEVDLQNVFKSGNENKIIPLDSFAEFKESGGVKGLIEWIPIDMTVAALTACLELRKQLLDDVYQITGISDIMRGDTDPRETKGAQVLKSQWGSSRVRERQKELARFARDNLAMKAEIIAEHFSWATLKAMTNVDLFTNEEKMMAQQQLQVAQQQAQMTGQQAPPPPPELTQKLARPTWEEVEAFLRNDVLRRFRIEVETDSTVEPDATQEKADMVEYITAVGGLITNAVPIVQAAPPMARLIAEMIKKGSRKFAFGRDMEETIDSVMDQIAQQPPVDPNASAGAAPEDPRIAQMEQQTEMLKLQIEKEKIAAKERETQTKAMLEKYGIDVDAMLKREQIASEDRRTQADREMAERQAVTDRIADAHDSERDREFAFAEGERGRQYEGGENERERQNRIDVTKARPKPGGSK